MSQKTERYHEILQSMKTALHVALLNQLLQTKQHLTRIQELLAHSISQKIQRTDFELQLLKSRLEQHNTTEILNRGYTLTLKAGFPVQTPEELQKEDLLTTIFPNFNVISRVEEIN